MPRTIRSSFVALPGISALRRAAAQGLELNLASDCASCCGLDSAIICVEADNWRALAKVQWDSSCGEAHIALLPTNQCI